ncbi:transketolase [Azorhizobium oxalatiphilum]|uniref:Transketolase n=1 Tax=Azorhizobium oxalatiphilum TaxID=980631 RepID=A0A917BHG9_9HYPH|nr:transketolase [Azorhizobium oxalatiphilum]GGF44695.1 transketolase [Azorhizobium oxalatiphilum]
MSRRDLHDRMAHAIRFLAIDAVEAANSGHPGLPMGAADIATVLFSETLKFDATQPTWPDRDRFILSAGHGSMLLYSLLHLLGYESLPMDELKRFRQLGSLTPGHPENFVTPGIETTTGPLGQGISTAVGFAMAERLMAARFSADIVDHRTVVIASDGDLMEGISQEAIDIAGHMKLAKLTVLWDDNRISIDGPTSLSGSTDQQARFAASGWTTLAVDGHDPVAILAALKTAYASDKPTLIACRTVIGFGSPAHAGSSKVHGSPLGAAEIEATRKALGWEAGPFEVPQDARDGWLDAGRKGVAAREAWQARFDALPEADRAEFERRMRGELPSAALAEAIAAVKAKAVADGNAVATRKSSEIVLDAITKAVPEMIGGSADLTGSNNTRAKGQKAVTPDDFDGTFIHWGVREHGMAAAMNGLALHGGVIPYSGTFLAFADYSRPAIRLAALMGERVVHVLTHDSIGLGEDGPTHQPVEHLAALRAIPNLLVMRPADTVETAECWQIALEAKDRPSCLILSRQNLPLLRQADAENKAAGGAYELIAASSEAQVSLFATGSELSLAVEARALLEAEGVPTRVVSVPSFELFLARPLAERRAVIGKAPAKVGIEAAIRMGWDSIIGSDAAFVGMTSFGASAPAKELYRHFGITPQAVVGAALEQLRQS